MTIYAIAVGVADVHSEPDPASELVTQALLNAQVRAGEASEGWTHVVLSDYTGWVRTDELAEPVAKVLTKISTHCDSLLDLVAIVTATYTPLYTDIVGEKVLDSAYLSSLLPLLDITPPERAQVALPGEQTAWIAHEGIMVRSSELTYPLAPASAVTTYARAYLDVPYLWGGTSWKGLDCSGFAQLCYRMGGYSLPRDADQQYDALAQNVERTEMREGDLIFFGRPAITHVGIALNEQDYIHAEGQHFNRVMISSLNLRSELYYKRLDEIVYGIKRVVL